MPDPFWPPEWLWRRLCSALGGQVDPRVRAAYELAARAHAGQRRAEGTPYIVHPLRVALILAEERGVHRADVVAAALLHDVLEDTDVAAGDIARCAGERVAAWVQALTKPPATGVDKAERDAAYFRALLTAPPEARLIKLADRLDNVRFLHLVRDPARCRDYRRETRRWLVPLAEHTDRWFARQLASFAGETLRPWEVLDARPLLEAPPWLSVHAERVEVDPAAPAVDPFYRVEMPEYVVIVPRLPDGRFLVLKGYKHGPRRIVYHVPAGYVEPDEAPLAAARRELVEETGHRAGAWRLLGRFVVDGNRGAGHAHLFLAQEVVPDHAPPANDDLEQHEVLAMTAGEIKALLDEDLLASLSMAAALGLAMWALAEEGSTGT